MSGNWIGATGNSKEWTSSELDVPMRSTWGFQQEKRNAHQLSLKLPSLKKSRNLSDHQISQSQPQHVLSFPSFWLLRRWISSGFFFPQFVNKFWGIPNFQPQSPRWSQNPPVPLTAILPMSRSDNLIKGGYCSTGGDGCLSPYNYTV